MRKGSAELLWLILKSYSLSQVYFLTISSKIFVKLASLWLILYLTFNWAVALWGTTLDAPSLELTLTISIFEGGKSLLPESSFRLHISLKIFVRGLPNMLEDQLY